MKIVDAGYKIDLHIHSIYSKEKDKNKVNYNTLEHLEDLITKLNEQEVQICAITDHDAFGYDIYSGLKANEGNGSIVKVFPGIEFSVEFIGDDEDAVVHVIAIFDDSNEEKVKKIANCLVDEKGKPAYDKHMAFSEKKFLEILSKIDLDTILIAHQKNSLSSSSVKKTDANSVGKKRFTEFVYTDYFEAYEFRNKKQEIFNKHFLSSNCMSQDVRFITGSDCHDWRFYPNESSRMDSEFRYTYVKCLPTFRGLVMAVTDYRRIKTVNSFFNNAEDYLSSIEFAINGKDVEVPLSKGINVIIGDNSIGKSLLLHKLTGYCKKKSKRIKSDLVKGYDKYLKQNHIVLKSEIQENEIFGFDMQGEVREKFENEKIKSDEFLKNYYPAPINGEKYRLIVERELEKIYEYLKEKYELETMEAMLGNIRLVPNIEMAAESLTLIGNVQRDNKKVEAYEKLGGDIGSIVEKIITVMENPLIEENDKEIIENIISQLQNIIKKYEDKKSSIIVENSKIGIFQEVLRLFKEKYQSTISDNQKAISNYNENIRGVIDSIVEIKNRWLKCKKPEIRVVKQNIEVLTNKVFEYEFNSRLAITEISKEYVDELISSVLRKDVSADIMELSQFELAEAIPYFEGDTSMALEVFKKKIKEKIDEDFKEKYTITQRGMDKTQELSSGFNAKIYFDLLSYESDRKGIYIIDQPEDNISQKAIREYLLDRFKVMGENRQVIIVTHNPQFIVNLDVDNVIYLGKNEDVFFIQCGALEYRDDKYSMLDIISTHIEGGLDTLKRRWKRYEKNNKIY